MRKRTPIFLFSLAFFFNSYAQMATQRGIAVSSENQEGLQTGISYEILNVSKSFGQTMECSANPGLQWLMSQPGYATGLSGTTPWIPENC